VILGGKGYYVTENLKNSIITNGLTGIEISNAQRPEIYLN
jgi:hypothetical protein